MSKQIQIEGHSTKKVACNLQKGQYHERLKKKMLKNCFKIKKKTKDIVMSTHDN